MDQQQFVASFALLGVMQDPRRSADERAGAYGEMLELKWGFWQREDTRTPQSLRKFALDVARMTIDRYGAQKHARMRALDADDLSQEILLCLFENAAKIRTSPRSWLIAVAVQKVRHYVAGNAATEFAPDFDAMTPKGDEPGPGELAPADAAHVVTREDVRKLRELTKGLPPEDRRAIRNRYLRGLNDKGTSLAMDKSEPATRKILSRARQKLRKQLDDESE
jgi:RNA polymerase sigma factor (sigma-70 family)